MPGPPPKRESQRRRRNKPAKPATKAAAAVAVEKPKGNGNWHPTASKWFDSLADSGQSQFYEPSDWATAYVIAESMSMEFRTGESPKAASLAAWLKGMGSLMVMEGDRRRASLELMRPGPDPSEGVEHVSHIDDARRRLRGAS